MIILRRFLIVVLVLAISGCALINPHVAPTEKTGVSYCIDQPNSIEDALNCANAWSGTYQRALGSQAKLRTVSGITLITLGGLALGYGITNTNSDALTWLGIGGAVGYGTSNWLANKPAQLAYVAGMKAISCAVTVVEPLSYMPDDIPQFRTILDTLNWEISSTENLLLAASNEKELYKSQNGHELVYNEAERQITATTALILNASQTYSSGMELLGKQKGAARALINTVQRISRDVDGIIVQSLPSLQSLPNVINGLAATSGMFTSLAPSTVNVTSTELPSTATVAVIESRNSLARHRQNLQTALNDLNSAASDMVNSVRLVAANVNAVGETSQMDTLIGCGVDEEKLTPRLAIAPSQIQINNGKDANRRLIISGGRAPYMAELLERPVENLEVSQPAPFGPRVLVEMKASAATGNYTIYVTDGAGISAQATLVIEPSGGAPGGVTPDNNAGSPTPGCPTVGNDITESEKSTLEPIQIFEVQRVVEVVADGKIGEETRMAVCDYQEKLGISPTGELDAETVEQAKQDSDRVGGIVELANNPFERSILITPDVVKEIQAKLAVDQTGTLDADTRTAIQGFETPESVVRAEKIDELSPQLVEAILNSG